MVLEAIVAVATGALAGAQQHNGAKYTSLLTRASSDNDGIVNRSSHRKHSSSTDYTARLALLGPLVEFLVQWRCVDPAVAVMAAEAAAAAKAIELCTKALK